MDDNVKPVDNVAVSDNGRDRDNQSEMKRKPLAKKQSNAVTSRKASKAGMAKTAKPKKESQNAVKDNADEEAIILPTKKILTIVAIIVVFALIVFGIAQLAKIPNPADKGIAARVNGVDITWDEINSEYDKVPTAQRAYITKADIVNQSIDKELVKQDINNRGINITDEEVEAVIDGLTYRFAGDKHFLSMLQDQGITYEDFFEEERNAIAMARLVEQIIPEVAVNDSSLEKVYADNKAMLSRPQWLEASHILLESESDAEAVTKMLASGGNFSEIALNISTDTQSGSKGGYLGFFMEGMFVPEFWNAAVDMTPGEISQPVRSQFGYHIILLHSKISPKEPDFKVLSPWIRQEMVSGNIQKPENVVTLNAYVQSLRTEAEIERLPMK